MMGTRQRMNGLEMDRVYFKRFMIWNHRSMSDVKPRLRRRLRRCMKIELMKVMEGRGG